MTTPNDLKLKELLQAEWQLLVASVTSLKHSVEKCNSIGIKSEYSFEEQESFDSLTSKFNRTSDIFTQKIIRTTWMLLHEPFVPFIDLMNSGEKLGIISNANQMIYIRDMRNQIAHEYIPEALFELVPEVIELVGNLMTNIESCEKFVGKRNWI
jgi:hypothetical protein